MKAITYGVCFFGLNFLMPYEALAVGGKGEVPAKKQISSQHSPDSEYTCPTDYDKDDAFSDLSIDEILMCLKSANQSNSGLPPEETTFATVERSLTLPEEENESVDEGYGSAQVSNLPSLDLREIRGWSDANQQDKGQNAHQLEQGVAFLQNPDETHDLLNHVASRLESLSRDEDMFSSTSSESGEIFVTTAGQESLQGTEFQNFPQVSDLRELESRGDNLSIDVDLTDDMVTVHSESSQESQALPVSVSNGAVSLPEEGVSNEISAINENSDDDSSGDEDGCQIVESIPCHQFFKLFLDEDLVGFMNTSNSINGSGRRVITYNFEFLYQGDRANRETLNNLRRIPPENLVDRETGNLLIILNEVDNQGYNALCSIDLVLSEPGTSIAQVYLYGNSPCFYRGQCVLINLEGDCR